jgi:hypothetical protein
VVFIVVFHAVVEGADLFFLQKTLHPFFELSAAFAGDDLDSLDAFGDGTLDRIAQGVVDGAVIVVYGV